MLAERDNIKNNKCKNKLTLIRIREPKCPELNGVSIDYKLKEVSNEEVEKSINFIFNYLIENYGLIDLPIINIRKDSDDIMKQYLTVIHASWEGKYLMAKQYYLEHGDLLIPSRYEVEGIKLGVWINRQRLSYNEGKLMREKINLLNEIGMVWNVKIYEWDIMYKSAKKYYNATGNLLIPERYIDENSNNLGNWLVNQRQWFKTGQLESWKIDKLNELSIVWDTLDYRWEHNFSITMKYYKENGHLFIPTDYFIDNVNIGSWISEQRKKYNRNKLEDYKIKKLMTIGMIWDAKDYQWRKYYNLAKKYFLENNNLLINHKYISDNEKLGNWIARQRAKYNDNKLSTDKINLLNEIGMVWDYDTYMWNENYKVAKSYFDMYGNVTMSDLFIFQGVNLGLWLRRQYKSYINNSIDKLRIQLLDKINIMSFKNNNL